MPNPSLRSVIFWQWANQTLNVAVNFSNANKSIEMTPQEIGTGECGLWVCVVVGVCAVVGVGVGVDVRVAVAVIVVTWVGCWMWPVDCGSLISEVVKGVKGWEMIAQGILNNNPPNIRRRHLTHQPTPPPPPPLFYSLYPSLDSFPDYASRHLQSRF